MNACSFQIPFKFSKHMFWRLTLGHFSKKSYLKIPQSKIPTWRIIQVSKWLMTMVIVSPLRIGLFLFQMAVLWLVNGGDPKHLNIHWGPIIQASQNPGSFFRDQFFLEPSSLRKTFPQKMSSLKFCTSSTKATFVTSLDTKGVKTLTLTGHTLFEGGREI